MNKIISISMITVFLFGCSEKKPDVNAENCKIENIEKIKSEDIRKSFATECFNGPGVKRGGTKTYTGY